MYLLPKAFKTIYYLKRPRNLTKKIHIELQLICIMHVNKKSKGIEELIANVNLKNKMQKMKFLKNDTQICTW